MPDPHANFAYSTVATAPSPATSGTSLVVAAGTGALFPAVSAFNATIWPTGVQPTTTNAEIVRVTNVATDTFTITRTQEATSVRSVGVGDQIAATITAKTLTDVEPGATWSALTLGTNISATATFNTPAATLLGNTLLLLSGGFTAGAVIGGGATILTLPSSSMFPVTKLRFGIGDNNSNCTPAACSTSGVITTQSGLASGVTCGLDGIVLRLN